MDKKSRRKELNADGVIIAGRKAKKTAKEIAAKVGCSTSKIYTEICRLHEEGKLTDIEAFGYRGREPKLNKKPGKRGDSILQFLSEEQCRRLKIEVEDGGYSGFNELFCELFKDYIAEQDHKNESLLTAPTAITRG